MENKPNKPRFIISIIDIIIIAVVVVAAAALLLVWRSSGKSSNTAANAKPIHYTIELNGMVGGTAGKIKAGDTILDSDKKFIMGTVESVAVGPAMSPAKNSQTGDTRLTEVPGRESAKIVLLCDCSSTESQITAASGYVVRVGNEVHAAGPGYAGVGYVIGVNREDLGQ